MYLSTLHIEHRIIPRPRAVIAQRQLVVSKFDRSAITKEAWRFRREAETAAANWDVRLEADLRLGGLTGPVAGETQAEYLTRRNRRIQSFTLYIGGRRPVVSTWADCMRTAWMYAKRTPETHHASDARIIAGVASFGNE